ncbi:MAG: hypothetical protein NXI24_23365 [bacterium]|nr:hypothetical protein [bacterium]
MLRSLYESARRLRGAAILLLAISSGVSCLGLGGDCEKADVSCDPTALLLYNAPCHARSWSTYFGAETGTGEFMEAVVQTSDAGYAMVGRAFQPFGSPILPFSSPGTRNIFVIKFNEDGAYQWHTFLGESTDRPTALVAAPDGLLVVGAAILGFGSPRQAFNTANDAIVAKLDFNGNLQWHTYFGTAGTEEVRDVVSDGAGNYVLAGKSVGNIANAGTVVVSNTDPATDQMFLMKIDGEGTPLWQSHFGGAGAEVANKITRFQNGYVISGAADTAFNGAFTNQRNGITGGGTNDFALVGVDFNGNYLWHTFQGAAGQADDTVSLETLADGRLLVGGVSDATWGSPVSPHPASGVQNAMAIFTLTADGDLSWNAFYGGGGATADTLSRAVQTVNGEIAFLGSSSASFGAPRRPYTGLDDLVVGALDATTGRLLRNNFYGSAATAEQPLASGFMQSCDNGFLVTGAGNGDFGSPIVPYAGTGFQALVLKLAPDDAD